MKSVEIPTAPKTLAVLKALSDGQKLTVAKALRKLNVYALSQECGRLRNLGWPVESKPVTTTGGAHVKEYFLPAKVLGRV